MNIKVQLGEDLFDKMAHEMGSMMDSMMDEMNSRNYFRYSGRDSWDPPLNCYEVADRFLVCVDLAGMELHQIDVAFEKDVLHIRGDRPKPCRSELNSDVRVHMMEIDSGRFHRQTPVPGAVNVDAVSASYQNGFLWIVLPKP